MTAFALLIICSQFPAISPPDVQTRSEGTHSVKIALPGLIDKLRFRRGNKPFQHRYMKDIFGTQISRRWSGKKGMEAVCVIHRRVALLVYDMQSAF